ncbi:MAG: pyrroline-5-carboxylate reductase [Lachnospiraceae bacterium]|nr:pyrroline-5-carboxylate reductase [Lachnospiraceae bacterium]
MYKIGFIGAGNMGGALIVAACKSIGAENVVINDYLPEKANELAQELGCHVAASNEELARSAEYIVLAVKPNVIRLVAGKIAPVLEEEAKNGKTHIVVTIAAGVKVAAIQECIGDDTTVLRIMPNTPAMVGKGMILLTGPSDIPEELFTRLEKMLAAAGDFERVNEGMIDSLTSVTSCAPAYIYMLIEAMADGAVQTGIPRDMAQRLAAKTVLGSAAMVTETGKHPGELKDAVCSPGGSTIVGVTALEECGFRNAVIQAIVRSAEKNKDLGK